VTDALLSPQDAVLRVFSPGGRANPYPCYRSLLEQAPVMAVGSHRALVTGYQESLDVLLNPRLFRVADRSYADRLWPGWQQNSSAALLYSSLLFVNSPGNQPVRRAVSRFFSRGQVDRMRPMIERHAVACTVSLITGEGDADATRSFTTIPQLVMAELLGIAESDPKHLGEWVDMLLERNELHPPGKRLADADGAAEHLIAYVREKLLAASADEVTSLAGSLARLDSLGEWDLISNLLFVLGAGTVTTASLLGSAVLQLARDNDLLRRLRVDDALLRSFALEVLRYDPPIQYGARVAAENTVLGGLPIARDSLVLVCFGALGQDPRRFPDPDLFIPDRFVPPGPDPKDVLSFGLGAHRCAGAELALATAEIAVNELARQVETLTIVGTPQRRKRAVARKFTRLEVRASGYPSR
jgi:cytochrome P450